MLPELARGDPWLESLERSLARRRKLLNSSIKPEQLRADRAPGSGEQPRHEVPSYWRLCWRALAKHWMALVMTVAGVLTLALLAATRPSVSAGQRLRGPARAASSDGSRAAVSSPLANSGNAVPGPRGAGSFETRTCQLGVRSNGYVNPLARAAVDPKRIDQGVDYAGSGTLTAIGSAKINRLATVDTGWPGAFIEYQLLSGPDRGCYVYYAEGLTPASGLYVGETVRAGQAIATIIPNSSSGIEIGWGAGDGTKSYASATGQWSATHEANDIPSAAGLYLSALIASLGGPPGKIEG
jgi:hypothetical protein